MAARLFMLFSLFSIISGISASSCVTPSGLRSQCVSLYECQPLLSAFEQRPLPSYVVTYLRRSQCGFVGYNPAVCCGPIDMRAVTTTTSRPQYIPTVPPQGSAAPSSRDDVEPAREGQCGADTNGDRIFGGQFTDLDEFPWMALLGYRKRDNSMTYECGGVLINKRYVLTAAHCVVGEIERKVGTLATVRLGEYDMQTDVDCMDSVCADPPQEIPVDRRIPHPNFQDGKINREDDIALVRMARRATYTYYVQPICLVQNNARLTAGVDVFVAGWGQTLSGRKSPVKLKLSLPIFNKEECDNKYRQRFRAVLTDKQLCAGGKFSEDTCRGDSGGPLMRKRPDGVWEAIGLVSFGNGCGGDGWPGVYTSVASYNDWIRSTIRANES